MPEQPSLSAAAPTQLTGLAADRMQQAYADFAAGAFERAAALCRELLAEAPGAFEPLHVLGAVALKQGDATAAEKLLRQAIEADPSQALGRINLAHALCELDRNEEAVAQADQAVALEPQTGDLWFKRGNVLARDRRFEDAAASYERAIALAPGLAEAYGNLSAAAIKLRRYHAALANADKAAALRDPFPAAWFNRGTALHHLGRLPEAVASYRHAIAQKPDYHEAHCNLGITLMEAGRLPEAVQAFDQALAIRPDYAEATWNRSLTLLLAGDLQRGWEGYEWRWKNPSLGVQPRLAGHPMWAGEPLAGKTILVHAEQGLGDAIQFARYVPLLAQRGARVLLQVRRPLHGLLRQLPGLAGLLSMDAAPPPFDVHCPILSLPLAFGTTLETIPSPGRYLRADDVALGRWWQRLGDRKRPRVGIAWAGNPDHPHDARRSIALRDFLRALPAGIEYVTLQKDLAPGDEWLLKERGDIWYFGDDLNDFDDTAALCELADAVVCVDTSVAHLAGALGRPAHVLLAHTPDWRWMLQREDSPWYASLRLLRQQKRFDWTAPLARLRTLLEGLAASQPGPAAAAIAPERGGG